MAGAHAQEPDDRAPSSPSSSPTAGRARRWWVRIGLGAALTLGAAAVVTRASAPPPVKLAEVVRGTAIDAVYASGTVEAVSRVEVKARVKGVLAAIVVKEGEQVAPGQLLARLDAPSLRIDLARRRAEALAARGRSAPSLRSLDAQARSLAAQLADAQAELKQAELLAAKDSAPARELSRARLRAATLEEEVQRVREQLAEARVMRRADVLKSASDLAESRALFLDALVRAPIAGTVLRVPVEPGQLVQAGEPLFRLGDLGHLQLEALADEEDVARVRAGAPCVARLSAFGDRALKGHVARVAPEAERGRHAFRIFVDLDEPPEGLRPGMSGEVDVIAARHEGAVLVPREAIRDGAVWRYEADGRLHRRAVKTGVGDLERVEVLGGLAAGDLVAAAPSGELRDGMRVRAEAAAATDTGAGAK